MTTTTSPDLDPRTLLRFTRPELASHFQNLVSTTANTDNAIITIVDRVNSQILNLIHQEAIPVSVFSTWLPIAFRHSANVLPIALRDPVSRGVRKAGILVLSRSLIGDGWKRTWDAVGGARGLREIIEFLPVIQVRLLAGGIGKCVKGPVVTGGEKGQERERQWLPSGFVEELVGLLLPSLVTSSSLSSEGRKDDDSGDGDGMQRTLSTQLLPLFRACSSSFLETLFSQASSEKFLLRQLMPWLVKHHTDLLRRIAVGRARVHPDIRASVCGNWNCIVELIASLQPYQAEHVPDDIIDVPSIPPGMGFCFDLIYSFNQDNSANVDAGRRRVYMKYVNHTIDIAAGRKTPFEAILALLDQGLSGYDDKFDQSFAPLEDPLIKTLIKYWSVSAFGEVRITKENIVIHPSKLDKLQHNNPSRPKPQHREALEALLVRFLRNFSQDLSRMRRFWSNFSQLVAGLFYDVVIVPAARLPLVKLLCKNIPAIDVDLDVFPPSQGELLLLEWDLDFLSSFPAADARALYERFLKRREQDIGPKFAEDVWYGKEGLLRVKWEAEEARSGRDWDAYAITRELLADCKKRAEIERDGNGRYLWANRALDIAAASRSVDLFKSVAEWSQRFRRDPTAGQHILNRIFSATSVLSCVDLPQCRWPPSITDLRASVETANSVLESCIQWMILASQEPSFYAYNRRTVAQLFNEVVNARIDGVKMLSRARVATEAELAGVLLDSLLPIFLEYERLSLLEAHEDLNWEDVRGPLAGIYAPSHKRKPPRHVLAFFDKLAKARDELWMQERIKHYPQVSSLSAGLPKGLAVQYLLPDRYWFARAIDNPEAAPYTAGRLREVLFCDSATAFTKVPSDTRFIGPFVDNLRSAVDFLIANDQNSIAMRKERVVSVWRHYSESVLSGPVQLACFKSWLAHIVESDLKIAARAIEHPVLPFSAAIFDSLPDATEMVTWNPLPHGNNDGDGSSFSGTENENEKEESATILQYRLTAGDVWGSWKENKTQRPFPWHISKDLDPLSIWKLDLDVKRLQLRDCEALILSSLLFIDTYTGREEKLLSNHPFPQGTSNQPRYSRVSLDPEFVSAVAKKGNGLRRAVEVIRRLAHIVPAAVLHDVTLALLERLVRLEQNSGDFTTIQETAFHLIKIMHATDRPELAVDLFLKAFRDLPNSSSWHRHLPCGRLGRSLPATGAEAFVDSFADFLIEGFGGQKKRPSAEKRESDTTAPVQTGGQATLAPSKKKPFVKITTVKILAQLLATANFISPAKAVDILRSLFHVGGHIDVRVAVIQALLHIMRSTPDSSNINEAYKVLVSLAPIAARPNERVRVTEEQWLAAESGEGDLPEVSPDRPLLELFTQKASRLLPERFHQAYVRDAVLPLLEESTKQHNRWMKAFVNRIELTPAEASVEDFGPFDTDLVYSIWRFWPHYYFPKSFLRSHHRARTLRYIDCRVLENVSKKLAAQNASWEVTNAGMHWRDFFKGNVNASSFSCPLWLLKTTLDSPTKKKEANNPPDDTAGDAITEEDIENEYCEQAAILLRNPYSVKYVDSTTFEVSLKSFVSVLFHVHPFRKESAQTQPKTTEEQERDSQIVITRFKRMTRRIIDDVESIRSDPTWSTDPSFDRKPPVLPPKLQLETFLLEYPHVTVLLDTTVPTDNGNNNNRYDKFTSGIISLIHKSTTDPSCLQYLETAMNYVRNPDIVSCALRLGDVPVEEHVELVGAWRVKLARTLLGKLGSVDVSLLLAQVQNNEEGSDGVLVRALFEKWRGSLSEFVRGLGWCDNLGF